MAAELKKWLPIAGGVVAGVIGLMLYQKHAAAAQVVKNPMPATATITLQPGATSVGVAPGGTVRLLLPSGATWNAATTTPLMPIPSTSVQPTGNQNFDVIMGPQPGNFPLNASWVDSTGASQVTALNISVSASA